MMGSVKGDDPIQDQCTEEEEEERIVVSVRLRPLNEKEVSRNEVVDWECMDGTTIVYKNHLSPDRTMYPTSYTFDRVFRCDCSTRQVYEEGARSVVLSAVSGINSSVFAYGQTSSGKTFTMSGITEYTMEDIFDYVHKHKEREFQLKFSAMEIYNESVRDLLSADNCSLRLLDDPERGTVVERLTEITLYDWNHFKELLLVCEAQRQIGETFLNEASSRSHQILRLTIESSTREFLGKSNSSHLTATLDFVDLAGSERASQALSAGSRLKEGSHINRSLLTLGTVIRKLSKGRTGHIPYRDSKLTRILQSSLGGNARTAIICTMSPARSYVEQSRNTLLFASCAKEVETSAHVNVIVSDKVLVKHLQRQLVQLENELRSTSPCVRPYDSDLLREKDSKIEELERCIRELTLRLDLALSQINDLQREAEHRNPPLWEGEYSYYPSSHVQPASESFFSDANFGVERHPSNGGSPVLETPHSPDRQSRLSYDDNYSVSDFEENHTPSSPFEQVHIGHHVSKGLDVREINVPKGDPYIVSVKMDEHSQTPHEIERYQVFEENTRQSIGTCEAGRHQDCDDHLEDYCEVVEEEGESLPLINHEKIRLTNNELNSENEMSNIIHTSLDQNKKQIDVETVKKLNSMRSSDHSNDKSGASSAFVRKSECEMKNEHENDGESSMISLKDIKRSLSALKDAANNKVPHISEGDIGVHDDISVTEIKGGGHINCFDNLTSGAKMKDVTEYHGMNQVSNVESEDALDKASKSIKNTKDAGFNAQVDLDTISPLHSDFKRLEEEIIDLWDTCYVSLVHRTYFFLLFVMGDSEDTVYMEVERRRFSFIKDIFSWGTSVVVDGRKLSPASSKRSLQKEREKLAKLMKKRLSSQERIDLYVKWGISLDAKRRSSQLAHRLWSKTLDMDHIKESANIVAKLVRFTKPPVPKEVFGLDLTNLRPKNSFKWKHNLSLVI